MVASIPRIWSALISSVARECMNFATFPVLVNISHTNSAQTLLNIQVTLLSKI